MRFATFEKNGGLALGISAGTRFLDISAAWTDYSIPAPANMQHIIESHDLYVPVVEKLAAVMGAGFKRPYDLTVEPV
jgi:hypothetical protein